MYFIFTFSVSSLFKLDCICLFFCNPKCHCLTRLVIFVVLSTPTHSFPNLFSVTSICLLIVSLPPYLSNLHSACLSVLTQPPTPTGPFACLCIPQSCLLSSACKESTFGIAQHGQSVLPRPALSGFLSLWPWLHCMAGALQWPGTGWSTCICLAGDQHEGFRECICSDLISAWLQDMASTHTQPQDPGLLSQTL